MSIQNQRQLTNTQAKLGLLEARLIELDSEPVENIRTRELTRQSLKKLVKTIEGRNRTV
jgi:hypothetical protein